MDGDKTPPASQRSIDEAGDWQPPDPERRRAERKLLRQLDTRLVPALFVIYVMNYVNRTAITAARLKGLEHDLGLSDIQYNVVLSILFLTLSFGQLPSNMILNKVKRPSIYIGSCVIAWGLASALSGVTNYGGMLACRFFIGLPEASFYPGAVYLLSCWYTKREIAFRSAILFSGLDIASAFGALVAAAILSHMEATLGIPGWRWLFIIEGCTTILLGLLVMWLLPDYPRNTRWIDDRESRLAQARLAEDAGEADQDTEADSNHFQGLKLAVADPLTWLFASMIFSQNLGRSVGQFFPTLAKTLGFSTSTTLLLTAPPWLLSAIICILSAWHADKTGERFFHISLWIVAMMVGFIVSLCTMSVGARYFSMFLMAIGDAGIAMTLVWVSNSVPRPPAKRAAAIGIANGIGNLGTLAGTFAWKNKWGPRYAPSFEISVAALAVSTAVAFVIRQRLVRINRQLDAGATAETNEERVKKAAHLEGITIQQALEKRKGFRYLY